MRRVSLERLYYNWAELQKLKTQFLLPSWARNELSLELERNLSWFDKSVGHNLEECKREIESIEVRLVIDLEITCFDLSENECTGNLL